jgi:hypothetical protein
MPDKLPDAVAAQLKTAEDLQKGLINPDPNNPNPNPDPNPAPAPAPAPDPTPPPLPEEDFKSKYDTLSGKYNAEVPRLYGEVGDLKVKLAEALTVINDFKAKMAAPPPAAPAEPPKGLTYLRKEMPELEEAINFLFEQRASELLTKQIDTKLKETDTKINNLEDTTIKTAYGTFKKILSDKVPNWAVMNEDPGFLKWLEVVEPYSGMRKADLITIAHDNLDADRVATFFNDYLKSIGQTPTPPAPPADPAKFVSPPKPSSAEPQPTNDKDFITTAEITQFYNDVALGRYKGRDEERKNNEAKINNALATGKIR